MDYLLRGDSPFTHDEWEKIDEVVVKTASQRLIGRRIFPLYGPLGAGVQSIHIDHIPFEEKGKMDLFGNCETCEIKSQERKYMAIPMIYKDFTISWRDVETKRQLGIPIDLSAAAAAAAACAYKEDDFIINGSEEFQCPGLLNASGRQVLQKSDWSQGENPFSDVAGAIEKLEEKGIYGPYALVTSPRLYVQMQRIQQGTGLLEINRVKELVGGKVYSSPVLPDDRAVLVAISHYNIDLVIGQDMITGYMGPEQLNHKMRVLETILLRIKRPDAIVTFE